MKTKQLLFQVSFLLLSLNVYGMDQNNEQSIISQEQANQQTANQNACIASHQALEAQLAAMKEVRQQNVAFAKHTIAVGTALAACYYTLAKAQQPTTRFIATAMTTSSLALSACQGVAGCAAVGVGYYQLHKLIYSGCVSEREFDALKKAYQEILTNVQAQQTQQTQAINGHAKELDDLQAMLEQQRGEQEDFVRTVRAHAQDLDEGRNIARRIQEALDMQSKTINANALNVQQQAKLLQDLATIFETGLQKGKDAISADDLKKIVEAKRQEPTTVSSPQIIIPNRVSEHAAVPQATPTATPLIPTQRAVTVQQVPLQKRSFFSCCDDDAIRIKQ